MRPACERCDTALPLDGDARICSYECTFCPACARELSGRCPNCGGELLPRPRRTRLPVRLVTRMRQAPGPDRPLGPQKTKGLFLADRPLMDFPNGGQLPGGCTKEA